MTSPAKIAANRANGAKSTGPKTPSGKRYSKINALKTALYCPELNITDQDRQAFEALRADLAIQLAPSSALRRIAFEQTVACAWRVKLALRMEAACLAGHLSAKTEEDEAKRGVREKAPAEWYATSEASIHRAVRFLGDLREHVFHNGPRRVVEDADSEKPQRARLF